MPRVVRRQRRRPSLKWCGADGQFDVPSTANLVAADGDALCPVSLTTIPTQPDITVTRILLSMTIARKDAGVGDEQASIGIWVGVVKITAAGLFSNAWDPFDVTTLNNQDTMLNRVVGTPPVIINSLDAILINRQSETHFFDIKAQRKLDRNQHGIGMFVSSAGATDNGFQYRFSTRLLMRF